MKDLKSKIKNVSSNLVSPALKTAIRKTPKSSEDKPAMGKSRCCSDRSLYLRKSVHSSSSFDDEIIEHTLQDDDTIETLAVAYGIPAAPLYHYNDIRPGSKLENGHKVKIPFSLLNKTNIHGGAKATHCSCSSSVCDCGPKQLIADLSPDIDSISIDEDEVLTMPSDYLKVDTEYFYNFGDIICGSLLLTSNTLLFSPRIDDSTDQSGSTEKYILQLNLERLRSLAVYSDPSVMYFTRRNKMIKRSKLDEATVCENDEKTETNEDQQKNKEKLDKSDTNAEPFIKSPEFYLCILAIPQKPQKSNRLRIQPVDFWFVISKENSEKIRSFLMSHGTREDSCNEETSTKLNSSGENCVQHDDGGSFLQVNNKFNWLLPSIGSEDDMHRTVAYRHRRLNLKKQLSKCEPPSSSSTDDCQNDPAEKDGSSPSVFEERLALIDLRSQSMVWEVISRSEFQKHQKCNQESTSDYLGDLDLDGEYRKPENIDESEILVEEYVKDLLNYLPPEIEGSSWELTFSTRRDGFSLRNLYRHCDRAYEQPFIKCRANLCSQSVPKQLSGKSHTDSISNHPCLLIIQTNENEVIGAVLNTYPIVRPGRFYGNGSCFVFHWIDKKLDDEDSSEKSSDTDIVNPCNVSVVSSVSNELTNFQHYTWSKENDFFINAESESLSIGSSDGAAAIRLDDQLLRGRSDPSSTFNSPELTSEKDFIISALEVWTFI